jgi:hypothetical protein
MIKEKDLEQYLNKKCKFSLKNGFFYRGKIEKINEGSVSIKDKYSNLVTFDLEVLGYIEIIRGAPL